MSKFRVRLLCAAMAGSALVITGIGYAKADPFTHDASLFCTWVHNDPTPRGVVNAVSEFVTQGVDKQTAIATINYAVNNLCSEYIPLINRTADMIAPKEAV